MDEGINIRESKSQYTKCCSAATEPKPVKLSVKYSQCHVVKIIPGIVYNSQRQTLVSHPVHIMLLESQIWNKLLYCQSYITLMT